MSAEPWRRLTVASEILPNFVRLSVLSERFGVCSSWRHNLRKEGRRGKSSSSYGMLGCGRPPRVRRQNAYATFSWSPRYDLTRVPMTMLAFATSTIPAKAPASQMANARKVRSAMCIGSAFGIETICAPTMSSMCQPKPWVAP